MKEEITTKVEFRDECEETFDLNLPMVMFFCQKQDVNTALTLSSFHYGELFSEQLPIQHFLTTWQMKGQYSLSF